MVCNSNQPFYIPITRRGINLVSNIGDGYTIQVYFHEAFTDLSNYGLAYNIYYSTERDLIFSDGPKYISTNTTGLKASLVGFAPGDLYYFAVRATEYDPSWYNPGLLPPADGYDGYLFIYPETLLLNNLSIDGYVIEIADIELFPAYGILQVGTELIRYESKDVPNSSLLISERGFNNTDIRFHDVDGYDGYKTQSPIIKFYAGFEDDNRMVIQEQIALSPPYNNYVLSDGYKTETDLVNTDLSASDEDRIDFPIIDHSGWRRTDPVKLFNGECVDTYIGGEHYCADGYDGVGNQIRNMPLDSVSDQRQEELLDLTGEPVVLLKRIWNGIVCKCVQANKEHPESRCPHCFGTGFVTGYEQYFYPRRSDGRIMVRFSPYDDDLVREEPGLESKVIHDCWTLVVPTIHDSDVIIRFNQDGTEEYRYEVLNATRNKLFFGLSGKQNFKAQRIRKTDIIYQWRSIRNTATMPLQLSTSVGLLRGPNDIPIPHTHNIVINENIINLNQINETTSMTAGHNHPIIDGVVQEVLGHTHTIIL